MAKVNARPTEPVPLRITSPPVRVTRPKIAVVVADAIAEDIFARGLKPGTLLATEAQMIDHYKVARATLREALRLLESEGLIVIKAGPNGGAIVQKPSPERLARLLSIMLLVSGATLLHVVEARRLLEPALAMDAALNAGDEDMKRIRDAVERLRNSVHHHKTFLEAAADFHSAVALASGNAALSAFWFAVKKISDGQQIGVHYGEDALRSTLRAHERIAEAIQKRDPVLAAAAAAKHMNAHLDYLKASYPHVLRDSVRILDVHD
jgi:GntR family transcriptional repressor for pyruvate dehydrogenase complex